MLMPYALCLPNMLVYASIHASPHAYVLCLPYMLVYASIHVSPHACPVTGEPSLAPYQNQYKSTSTKVQMLMQKALLALLVRKYKY